MISFGIYDLRFTIYDWGLGMFKLSLKEIEDLGFVIYGLRLEDLIPKL